MESLEQLKNAIDNSQPIELNSPVANGYILGNGQWWLKTDDDDLLKTLPSFLKNHLLKSDFFVEEANENSEKTIYFNLKKAKPAFNELVKTVCYEMNKDNDIEELISKLVGYFFENESVEHFDLTDPGNFYIYIYANIQKGNHYFFDHVNDITYYVETLHEIELWERLGSLFLMVRGQCFHFENGSLYSFRHFLSIPFSQQALRKHHYVSALNGKQLNDIEKHNTQRLQQNQFPLYCFYSGIAYTKGFLGAVSHYVTERVVCDVEGAYFQSPHDFDSLLSIVSLDHSPSATQTLQNDELSPKQIICQIPYIVFYDLDAKEWRLGTRDNIMDIEFRTDAIEKLDINEQKKRTLKTICVNQSHNQGDLISGKGGGHIFLLHGPPGTGKTLTAESIAEVLEKPLLKVGIGELGTNLSKLESNLKEILFLSQHWGAILLIDEADVFMEERTNDQLERNAMVAVFLRLLEYYSGILFLTPHRAKNFDEAFKSRITFALHYPQQTKDNRIAIWKGLLEGNNNIHNDDIIEFSEHPLNGRQIKNIINTAQCLSTDGRAYRDDVDMLIKNTIDFEKEIKDS